MKSEKEFLDGIYKKAEQYEEKPRKSISYKAFMPAVAAVVMLIIALPSLILNKPQENKNEPQTLSIDEPGPETANFQIDPRGVENVQNIVTGKVKKLEEKEGYLYALVDVDKTYEGTINGTIVIWYNNEENKLDQKLEKDEYVLLYLSEIPSITEVFKNEESDYSAKVINGPYGIYHFVKEENGDKIFEADDGTPLSTSLLEE